MRRPQRAALALGRAATSRGRAAARCRRRASRGRAPAGRSCSCPSRTRRRCRASRPPRARTRRRRRPGDGAVGRVEALDEVGRLEHGVVRTLVRRRVRSGGHRGAAHGRRAERPGRACASLGHGGDQRPACTRAAGAPSTSAAVPCSSTSPPRMTRIWSASCATTDRSWLIRMIEAPRALHLLELREHLRLHRHVERGGRLVRDHDVGVERDGGGDQRALAQAARELVGPLPRAQSRERDADPRRAAR